MRISLSDNKTHYRKWIQIIKHWMLVFRSDVWLREVWTLLLGGHVVVETENLCLEQILKKSMAVFTARLQSTSKEKQLQLLILCPVCVSRTINIQLKLKKAWWWFHTWIFYHRIAEICSPVDTDVVRLLLHKTVPWTGLQISSTMVSHLVESSGHINYRTMGLHKWSRTRRSSILTEWKLVTKVRASIPY